jgi:SAM-dependent methyltransferase
MTNPREMEPSAKSPGELHGDQIAFWNGVAGAQWVAEQARTDIMLAPVAEALMARAAIRTGENAVDIGCGCGSTTLAVAAAVGPTGRVLGLDVSAPMLARARERSAALDTVDYVCADATTHAFPTPFADLLISRFGVMFFGDPVAAFANLRRALKPGGRLVFACWRAFDQNHWMQVPLYAAYAHVPRLPRPGPEDPGPFSFAEPERVTRILTQAGFAAPRFDPVDLTLDLAGGKGLDAAVVQARSIGAASRALQDQPEAARTAAIAAIREALAKHQVGGKVPLPGAIWLVETRVA